MNLKQMLKKKQIVIENHKVEFVNKDISLDKKENAVVLDKIFHSKIKNKTIIGVTGTNGKTTTGTLIYNFLKNQGKTVFYGSNGIETPDGHYEHPNTTCPLDDFYKYVKRNTKYIVMEISSISFFEYRLFNIPFNYIILTNIKEDHLDYHKTLKDYFYSKALILATNFNSIAIVNDEIEDLNKIKRLNYKTITFGINRGDALGKIVEMDFSHCRLQYNYKNYQIELNDTFFGEYNQKNIISVITLFLEMKFNKEQIIEYLEKPMEVLGRFNLFSIRGIPLIVDYPHTESAYEELLYNLSKYCQKNLITVFGCGGNRQKSKRYKIAKIVEKYSSVIIVTNDNPRTENEQSIIEDIQLGFEKKHFIEYDRKLAIKKAIDISEEDDIVLVLGKGAEKYELKNGSAIPYSDIDYIRSLK